MFKACKVLYIHVQLSESKSKRKILFQLHLELKYTLFNGLRYFKNPGMQLKLKYLDLMAFA